MRVPALVLPLALTLVAAPPRAGEPAPLRGFSAASARAEREWEAKFRAIPDPARMREAMRRLSARPHHVGSPYDRDNAEWLAQQFRGWGWDAAIERFDVLFPTPVERRLELVAPTTFRAALVEPPVAGDPTSAQQREQLPTYNAYGADGDVTAPLVYVNYGMPEDYDELQRHGVSVKGAIVLARYGGGWRGIKPKLAAEHGAVGCLIFSDPAGDGYAAGAVYPQGPMRPPEGVQRGSVADMPVAAGDPLTIGVAATKRAKRTPLGEARTLMTIPVLPISYADAQPFLAALRGPVVPPAWRGGLPVTYRFGGTGPAAGPARAHLVVKSDWSLKPVYDVIAKLPGTGEADEWVIRGNHHDAWVNGAEDPVSGLVAELEEARALGELYRGGWRPKRTIVYAAWDGEEPGLLGSTEWVEAHGDELARHAVAYLNGDTYGRGFLSAGGSHTLESLVDGVARDVTDPETGLSVWQRARANTIRNGSDDEREALRGGGELRLDALGSGSDFTPFLQHAGVAALDLGYGGEDGGGIYHSIYDDFTWFTRFSDTAFVYGRALAQTTGLTVMRLAGADVLPYRFTSLAATAGRYVKELEALRDERAKAIAERARQLDEGVFAAVSDPRDPTVAPPRLAPAPHLNFAPLQNAVDSLAHAASRYETAYARWAADSGARTAADEAPADTARLHALNRRLLASERLLTSPAGLPGRPWYRHLLYAPGLYTGYGVKTMPAVREAIEQGRWSAVDGEIARVAAALTAEAEEVGRMAAMFPS